MRVEKGHHIGKQRSPRVLVPGYGEAQEINKGVKKEGKLSKLAKSKLIRTAVVLAGVSSGIQIAHFENPDIPSVPALYQEAKQGIESLLPDNGPPSKGDFFNPKRDSGEISSLNTVPLSIDKQVALINEKTNRDGTLYLILPDPVRNTVSYAKDGDQNTDFIGFNNLPINATFVSPYNGYLQWQKYYNGKDYQSMIVFIITKVRQSDGSFSDRFLGYRVSDIELLFPDNLFATEVAPAGQGYQTIVSSQTPIKAGQPIFKVMSNRFVSSFSLPSSSNNRYQVEVSGGNILSNNNKAIVAP